MNFNELFVDKSKTLIINTDLALVLGDLNEAIVLNQLNYWLGINKKAGKNFIDDRYWVYLIDLADFILCQDPLTTAKVS